MATKRDRRDGMHAKNLFSDGIRIYRLMRPQEGKGSGRSNVREYRKGLIT